MAPESMKKRIDQLLEKSPFAGLSADLKLALKSQLQALITDANLITREEFEIQYFFCYMPGPSGTLCNG